jgi:hypothetical protein
LFLGIRGKLTGLFSARCQVSRLQVAELVAAAVANPELAENKVMTIPALPQWLWHISVIGVRFEQWFPCEAVSTYCASSLILLAQEWHRKAYCCQFLPQM